MDFYEVVPVVKRYRRTVVEQDGETLFFYQTNRSTPDLKPTTEYLGFITEGLKSHPGASAEYRNTMASIATGEPGRFVSSYLWNQPENRTPWLRYMIDSYQLFALRIFLLLIYKYSLTARFIRL